MSTEPQKPLLEEKNLPAPKESSKAIGFIAVLYILFVLVIGCALIALSIFLFRKFCGWIG